MPQTPELTSTQNDMISNTKGTLPENKEEELKTKKRSSNWSPLEEEQLAKSWLHISEDPEASTNQTSEIFYKCVSSPFNSLNKGHECNADQMRIRGLAMNTSTLEFSAIYKNLSVNPPSGSSPSYWVAMSKDLYQANNKVASFKLDKAWEVSRNAPKWVQEGLNNRQDSVVQSIQSIVPTTPSESQDGKRQLTSSEPYLNSPF
ncbi:hypothetical protein O181_005934 [Austropuccinia psidii MF-1]|uniref:No apical meristem-associated C-terminal domain-containing protein n=1 Tax=Austropuccinia psidii MF-1 TaxID=1389203 RepID=A0A9Q3BJ32_9BASI|nr:hypothetical protein [Austropuccinia psidii MF-1]